MNYDWLYIILSLFFLVFIFLIQDVFWSFWEQKGEDDINEAEKKRDDF